MPAEPGSRPGPGGDWPRTKRVLPWLLAAFVAMLWLVPFDAIALRVPMPIDPLLDRFALAALVIAWGLSLLSNRPGRARLRPLTAVDIAVAGLVLVAVASVLLNLERIAFDGELTLSMKKMALLVSFCVFFTIASTTLRAAELRPFSIYVVALACLTAAGTLWEYRMRTNLFFEWAANLAPPGFDVGSEGRDPPWGRRRITGPTGHGLAATTMLGIALPFAVIGLADARERRKRVAYALATIIIVAGAMSTLRKTAAIAPAAGVLVLLLYRPRRMVRLLPFGVVAVLGIQLLAPGAVGSIRKQLRPDRLETAGTVQERVADYDATQPDRRTYPALGRGYGTYDVDKYRLLDNQYLGIMIGTGYFGLAAYIGLWLATVAVAHPAARSGDRTRAPPALAAAAAAVVFATASALFDVMAFPHVPYLFLLVAGMAVVAARRPARVLSTLIEPPRSPVLASWLAATAGRARP